MGVQVGQDGVGGSAGGVEGTLDGAGVAVVAAHVEAGQEAYRAPQVVGAGIAGTASGTWCAARSSHRVVDVR